MKTCLAGFCLAALLAAPSFADGSRLVQTEVLARTSASWDGARLPEYLRGTPEVTILRIRIPPGTQLPQHRHPVINAGVLLSGTLTVVTDEQETLHMKAGDSLVEVVNKAHYGKNDGDQDAEILVFYAGIAGMPISEKTPPQAE